MRILLLLPAILLASAKWSCAELLPPVQPRYTLCQPQHFLAATGATLAKATGGRITATIEFPRWGDLLDQGRLPACTGFGTGNWGNASPQFRWDWGEGKARNLWMQARDRDKRLRGDPTSGAYVGDLLAVLKERGLIGKVETIWNATMLKKALLTKGPCMMSTPIYFDMYFPVGDTIGRIRPTGEYVGDHWWVVLWYFADTDEFLIANSWKTFGPWAKFRNVVRISGTDMALLMRWGGQAVFATKPKKAK